MQLYLGLVAWAAVAFVLFKAANWVIMNRSFAAKARELGAHDAPKYPGTGFLGLKHLKYIIKADKDQLFPDMLQERQHIISDLHGREVTTFYGDLLGQKVYFTSDPRNIQALLATKFQDFDLGAQRHGVMTYALGEGIFGQDGPAWEHSRALLRPNFVREQVSDLDMEERHVQSLMKVLPVQQDGWTAITDIQTLFFRFTIDSATEFLFGESVDSQLAEAGLVSTKSAAQRNREAAFSKSFDAAQRHMAFQFRLGDFWWVSKPKSYVDDVQVMNDFIAHYVDLALQKTSSSTQAEKGNVESTGKEHYVLLNALANGDPRPSAVEIRGQLLNILLAGRDTTASLLSWTFHQLLRHPEVFTKLRESIIADFGTYNEPKNLSFSALKSSQYLQWTLSEVLRLWTVVPGNGRRTNKMTTLPTGGGPDGTAPILLPADTEVTYSIHVMHRRTALWGADAAEFRPERFQGKKPGWEFLPFNGGPRICIGQQFALTEASFVMVRLLQRFDKLEAPTDAMEAAGEKVRSNLTLTNAPAKLVTLRFREATE